MNYYEFNKYFSLIKFKIFKNQFFFYFLKIYIFSIIYLSKDCLIHEINQVVDVEKNVIPD